MTARSPQVKKPDHEFEVRVLSASPFIEPPNDRVNAFYLAQFARSASTRGKQAVLGKGKAERILAAIVARLRLEPSVAKAARLLWSPKDAYPKLLRALVLHRAFPKKHPRPPLTMLTLDVRPIARGLRVPVTLTERHAFLTRLAALGSRTNAFTRAFGSKARTKPINLRSLWLWYAFPVGAGTIRAVVETRWVGHLRRGMVFFTTAGPS